MSAPQVWESPDLLSDQDLISLWDTAREDPVFHVKEIQGVETLESFQEGLLRAVRKYERVAVRSCHDMGKSLTMSKLVLWFTSTHEGAKIVTTAPTARQVELLLWSEIRAGHSKSKYPLGGEMGVKQWKIEADWWAVGFTTQKEAGGGEQGQKNSGFQGIHAPWVLVIFDEATGIPADVWKQLEGLMTSANVRFVAIGNPTTKACEFFNCFSDPTYKKLHFSCYDSPNLRANGIINRAELERELQTLQELPDEVRLERLASYEIVRPHLLTTRWVMSMALKWGLDHPLFVSKVEGDFPEQDDSCLFPLGLVEAAQVRKAPESEPGFAERFFLGVDVARKGGDKSVLTRLQGCVHKETRVFVKRETTVVSGAVINMVNKLPEEERLAGGVIVVDATGIGSGVCDQLTEYKESNPTWRNIEIVEFHAAETWKSPRDGSKSACERRAKQFTNKKAESFWLLAAAVKNEIVMLSEDVYLEELPTILFKFDSKGRIIIEDKDSYKKRTGRGSPDHTDSLALANYGRYYSGGVGEFQKDSDDDTAEEMNSGELW